MEELEYTDWWTIHQLKKVKKLDPETQKKIAKLHSKYFNHSYYLPCSCTAKTWQQWVSQLNDLYDKGSRQST